MTTVNVTPLIINFKNKYPGTKNYKVYGIKSIGQLYTSTLEDTYKLIDKNKQNMGIKLCINILLKYKYKNIINKIKVNMNE